MYSDIVVEELTENGYFFWELERFFSSIQKILTYIEHNEKMFRRARDIALKRKIPIKDVLHAYLARYADAMLVSRDHHFKRLADTVKNAQPEELL